MHEKTARFEVSGHLERLRLLVQGLVHHAEVAQQHRASPVDLQGLLEVVPRPGRRAWVKVRECRRPAAM